MNVLVLMLFVSVALVAAGFLLFAFTLARRTFDHADRLALAPLEDADDAFGALAERDAQRLRGPSSEPLRSAPEAMARSVKSGRA